jgi:hypothetical protein
MPGRPPKSTNTLRGTVDGIAFPKSVTRKKKIFEDLRAAQKAKQEALEAESKRLMDENDSSDDEVLSLRRPTGGNPRKSRRHPRRSRKNKRSRRRRQRHH